MSDWNFMPFLHFVRISSDVFFEDSTHWSLTDSWFCSHYRSRTTRIPSQLFPRIFHQTLHSKCTFSAMAWSVACFTSFLELFNYLPNSFKANMRLFRDARITLTFFMEGCDCNPRAISKIEPLVKYEPLVKWLVLRSISKINFYSFLLLQCKIDIFRIKTKHKTKDLD